MVIFSKWKQNPSLSFKEFEQIWTIFEWLLWLQRLQKNFLEAAVICLRYLRGALRPGISNALTFGAIRPRNPFLMQEKCQNGDFFKSEGKSKLELQGVWANLNNFWVTSFTSKASKNFSRGRSDMFQVSTRCSKVRSFQCTHFWNHTTLQSIFNAGKVRKEQFWAKIHQYWIWNLEISCALLSVFGEYFYFKGL